MDAFAKIPHKLSRDGYGQLDRTNPTLSPSEVKIDGRETKELLQFLHQYARQINYYETHSNQRAGDWIPFFRNSIPFQYAVIASYDLDALDDRFEKVSAAVKSRLTFESLNLVFDLLFDLTDQITQWLADLEQDNSGLKRGIDNMIETNLNSQFLKLIKLANSAGKWGYKRAKNNRELDQYWGIGITDLYGVDQTLLSLKGSLKRKVLSAYVILERLYRTFWKAAQTVISIANDEKQLEKSLTNDKLQNHEPHLGLLFAFIRLFKEAQGGLNQLSESHLDFFYKKTLQLKNQSILPDHAHLTFELAKKVEEDILIEKGTRFKAGKDANGQDVFFELEEELIVTKAKIADLRTLFINRNGGTGYQQDIKIVEGVYMSPIANSADGLGEAFVKENEARWSTVGAIKSKFVNPDTTEILDHPHARLGFMLASKVLFLREGKRTIEITLTLNEPLEKTLSDAAFELLLANIFEVSLTTEKGWLSLKGHTSNIILTPSRNDKNLTFVFTLPSDFPPVVATEAALLEADYGYALPMIKFELLQQDGSNEAAYCYADLRQKMICEIKIDVKVCDVRQLILQNDLSILDANKPFTPFGPIPKKNSSNFYIGSEEVFCKRWEAIEISPVWKDVPSNLNNYYQAYESPPTNNNSFTAKIEILSDKRWSVGNSVNLFSDSPSVLCPETKIYWKLQQNTETASVCTDLSNIQNGYQAQTACGFLRLELGNQDFLHDAYANTLISTILNLDKIPELKQKIIDWKAKTDNTNTAVGLISCNDDSPILYGANTFAGQAKNLATEASILINTITDSGGEIPLPNAPYTPLIESISINYTAIAESSKENEIIFTHLHPFTGTYEKLQVDASLCNANELGTYSTSVLPCFIDEGALYIGLENFKPGSNLNLYFQMEPASADPDVDKAVVCWEYLRNNEWKPLAIDTHVLSDTTNGLIQSGILKFAIPASISKEQTTIMSSHLHWLKARVLLRTAAISETYTIQTQSAQATFVPSENSDLSRLQTPLGAMQIAKFESPLAAIKGVQQTYAGFGGRPEENAEVFYQRVSEHLRHKGRAITIYDYERIVLQHFENIYKVKCISHTLGRRGQDWDFELAPGFVTIVVIPDLNKVKAVNPLRPKVPAATLNAIKEMLRTRTSPFIKIEVLNPIFETVNVRAKVKFKPGKSNTFYQERLHEEVTAFLAPWAFSKTRQDISFGGKIYYATLLKFIEDRNYVEFLVDFSLEDKDGKLAEVIAASNSRVVLTSGQHEFTVIETTDQLAQDNPYPLAGIGYSEIPKI